MFSLVIVFFSWLDCFLLLACRKSYPTFPVLSGYQLPLQWEEKTAPKFKTVTEEHSPSHLNMNFWHYIVSRCQSVQNSFLLSIKTWHFSAIGDLMTLLFVFITWLIETTLQLSRTMEEPATTILLQVVPIKMLLCV